MSATTQHSTIKSTELENIMSYCYGTENYYKIPQYSFKYTDGAKTFCEKADAYWLLDIVVSVSRHYKQMHEDFIIIEMLNQGYTKNAIAHKFKVHRETLREFIKKNMY